MSTLLASFLLVLVSELPLLASTEEGAAHHQSLVSTIAPYINFAILVGVLVYLLRKPMKDFLAQKREAVGKMLKDSEQARDEALSRLAALQSKLESLEADIDQIRQQAEREAQAEKERLIEEAKEDARRIVEGAEKEISNRVKLAIRELKTYVAGEAVAKAEEIIREKIKDDSHEKLIDTYLENLSRN